ncbi:Protein CBG13503 [Caenorhabditis briggsae]|uniref:Bestrophin homolog n=2 Tax=Caenorhabditis briggsae TaxID=6238 RepID=A8XI17_CAEBR|nr:Protein CBG13503 [Caenorhabditis briggsae]CAP32290.1 Protein CBG13503 [Caenorhabditis briggsae]
MGISKIRKMTVSYNLDVSSTSLIAFLKLQLRWRGSVWKSVMRELLIFSLLFAIVTSIYRTNYFLSEEQRFTALLIATYIRGNDEKSRILRRTTLRYMVLTQVIIFRDISMRVRRRFPTLETVVAAGFMLESEREKYVELNLKYNKYFLPIQWCYSLLYEARAQGKIGADVMLNELIKSVGDFRRGLGQLCNFDWVPIPLVYPQTGLAIVDDCYNDSPPIQKDIFWSAETVEPLYSADTANLHMNPQIGSAAAYEPQENEIIMRPHIDTNDDFEDGCDDVEECNPRRLPRGISVVSVNRNCESRTSLVSRRNPGPTIMERLRSQFGGSKVNRPGKLFGSSQFSINTAIGDNDIGSCASILGELADDANKASQGLLTPEEFTGSPRRTPIDVLTSVPEEDEEAQKTRTSVDLRKWKEMVDNEKKRKEEEDEKKRKLSRKEEEKEEENRTFRKVMCLHPPEPSRIFTITRPHLVVQPSNPSVVQLSNPSVVQPSNPPNETMVPRSDSCFQEYGCVCTLYLLFIVVVLKCGYLNVRR